MEKALLVLLETTSFKMCWKGGLEVGQRITLLLVFTWRTCRSDCGDHVMLCFVGPAARCSPDPVSVARPCTYALRAVFFPFG